MFSMRALELHGRHIWSRDSIVQALDVIVANRLTTLVLHETDIVQMVTYPRAYLDPHGLWQRAPTRRGENAIENNRIYFDHVLRLARARGIEVLIEVKEIGFPDEILELRPELIKHGTICPSEPFWYEFIERKTDEIFTDFPLLAGMISSAGSTEGKASRAQGKCRCERCAETSLEDWYLGIIAALHRAASRHGKTLAIRDFAYSPADHAPLIRAVDRAPAEVIFCAKVTPHDFYLTFPDNPAIARRARPMWIEYDTMGQFYGWGIFPCLVLDDLRARLGHAAAAGVSGGLFRVEWERINDYWSIGTPNEINLIAAAAIARGEDIGAASACAAWLAARGWPTAAAEWLAGILQRGWPILRRALYIDSFVFADNSMYPRSLARAWWGMEVRDALHTWDPSRTGALRMSAPRVAALVAEKTEAVALAHALAADVRNGDAGLPAALHAELITIFDRMAHYVAGFLACAEPCLLARWLDPASRDDAGPGPEGIAWLAAAIGRLEDFADSIRPLAEQADAPHQLVMLMDHRRAADIAREGRTLLGGLRNG
jgi:hypothetical protein